MPKHKGAPHRDWDKAVDNAADKALQASGPGTYVLVEAEVTVARAAAGEAPGHNPIRDYRITLEGPQ